MMSCCFAHVGPAELTVGKPDWAYLGPLFIKGLKAEDVVGSQKIFSFAPLSTMLKRVYISIILLCFVGIQNLKAQADTAKVGIFVYSLYDFDLANKSFSTVVYIWVNHTVDSLTFENSLEITNAKSTEYSMYFDEEEMGIKWVSVKCRAQIISDWDISDFPFDKQVLVIQIEEGDKDTSDLVYVADIANSKIHEDLKLKDWDIVDFKMKDGVSVYKTSYGDPGLSNQSGYAMVKGEITLKRIHVWTIFFKLFTGVFVGFLIALMVFFIKPINVDPRFGLCVGGLFAAVGNKYVVESTVSTVSSNTLIDTLHNLTFVSILVVIFISIISLYIFEKGGEKNLERAKKLDMYSFIIILVTYISLSIYFVRQAMHG